jgi:tagatose 1,6-diphosphate aldolase
MLYQTLEELRDVTLLELEMDWLTDGDLSLKLVAREPFNPSTGWVPVYRFDMLSRGKRAGGVSLRVANTPEIVLYLGHIGYGVDEPFRGRRYAARACRLLLPLAKHHHLDPLWITCNPDNWASRRSCELAGGVMIEIVDVPPGNALYQRGEKQKCRYRIDLALSPA